MRPNDGCTLDPFAIQKPHPLFEPWPHEIFGRSASFACHPRPRVNIVPMRFLY